MKAAEIRRRFLDFFVERGHREVPSAPVVPNDDPTLLFTNAGMNQFKDVFLGTGSREYARAVDTQKCIRVSGKHNDLEEVGRDTYHHTFFEMLGNWSFGDYFKEDAIRWAWELLTEVWGLPAERLWVTVFAGDEGEGLEADEEAEHIWRAETDVDPAHVLRFGRKDNFWEMGETGPCGPCTEIHIDRGPSSGKGDDSDGADPEIGVNAGNERFIELWNLVFIQFQRLEDGSLQPLAKRHVDTGMGFERIVSVLQGKSSNYDTDVFAPIFELASSVLGTPYGRDPGVDVALRVLADHVRAVSAALADGALPSNVGRGYVLRRLIRRASRYGRQALGREEPFLYEVVPAVAETLGEVFPEIPRRIEHVKTVIRAEEVAFGKTLGRGILRFGELAGRVEKQGAAVLPGEEAYELYATYGFPRDLVELMARERALDVDEEGWDLAERRHQEKSRAEGTFRQLLPPEAVESLPPTESTFYEPGEEGHRTRSEILGLFAREGDREALVLDRSPFYAESGGQIGDSGTVEGEDGSFRFRVEDTQKIAGIVVHLGVSEGSAAPGLAVEASVDAERRERIRKNHTATHLLHQALREVVGDHVVQQGSFVGPDHLRFDFSHPGALGEDEIERLEATVNARIYANAPVATTIEDLEAAKARGVVALFGEKYDERVRVVDVDGWSTELCGGTHVRSVGDIGPFVIVSESAIQAGVRRLECVTGPRALEVIQAQRRALSRAARALRVRPDEVPERLGQLQAEVKEARKLAQRGAKAEVGGVFERLQAGIAASDPGKLLFFEEPLDQPGLRELSGRLKGAFPDLALVLVGRAPGGGLPWIVLVQGEPRGRGLDARRLVPRMREHLGGGGGGKPELCQGQGRSGEGLPALAREIESEGAALLADGAPA